MSYFCKMLQGRLQPRPGLGAASGPRSGSGVPLRKPFPASRCPAFFSQLCRSSEPANESPTEQPVEPSVDNGADGSLPASKYIATPYGAGRIAVAAPTDEEGRETATLLFCFYAVCELRNSLQGPQLADVLPLKNLRQHLHARDSPFVRDNNRGGGFGGCRVWVTKECGARMPRLS